MDGLLKYCLNVVDGRERECVLFHVLFYVLFHVLFHVLFQVLFHLQCLRPVNEAMSSPMPMKVFKTAVALTGRIALIMFIEDRARGIIKISCHTKNQNKG